MYFLLKMEIFHCYVCLLEGTQKYNVDSHIHTSNQSESWCYFSQPIPIKTNQHLHEFAIEKSPNFFV